MNLTSSRRARIDLTVPIRRLEFDSLVTVDATCTFPGASPRFKDRPIYFVRSSSLEPFFAFIKFSLKFGVVLIPILSELFGLKRPVTIENDVCRSITIGNHHYHLGEACSC